jgi:catalase
MPMSRYGLSPKELRASAPRLAVIVIALLITVVCFAGAAGWLSPGRLTPAGIVNTFQQVNGLYPGFRRNHAKGVCVTGYFDANGRGAVLSKALVFEPGRTPVFGRFALAGGHPFMVDVPGAVRSMALNFSLRDGQAWRTGMNDIAVFPVSTAAQFEAQLRASQPDPATGKPDPAQMSAFLAANPETVRAIALIRQTGFSSGFANSRFNSLDAFRFVDARGVSRPVRWSMVPVDAFQPNQPTPAQSQDPNYLFDALIARVARGPVQWHLVVTVGQSGDVTDDATVPWPEDRSRVDVGTLTIDSISDEAHGVCRDINFDPLILPAGIAASDDPLLSARSAAYSRSFTRREGERKEPSMVQVPGTLALRSARGSLP